MHHVNAHSSSSGSGSGNSVGNSLCTHGNRGAWKLSYLRRPPDLTFLWASFFHFQDVMNTGRLLERVSVLRGRLPAPIWLTADSATASESQRSFRFRHKNFNKFSRSAMNLPLLLKLFTVPVETTHGFPNRAKNEAQHVVASFCRSFG